MQCLNKRIVKLLDAVFLDLMLIAVSSSQQTCHMQPNKERYYIYSGDMEIKTYYCFNEENYQCENFRNSTTLRNYNGNILDRCRNHLGGRRLTVCELPVHVNLVMGTVAISENQSCVVYFFECLYDDVPVIWEPASIFGSLLQINKGNFSVSDCGRGRKLMHGESNNSFMSVDIPGFHDGEVWERMYDHKYVLALKDAIPRISVSNFSYTTAYFQSTVVNRQSTNSIRYARRKYYVYEYPVNVTVTFCVTNLTTCNGDKIVGNRNLLHRCKHELCDSPLCTANKLTMFLCSKTLMVDLEKDKLVGLPRNCKYSDGLCKLSRAFWQYTDRCGAAQKVFEGYEHEIKTILLENSTELSLLRPGTLCGKKVWFTNEPGYVASEESFPSVSRYEESLSDGLENSPPPSYAQPRFILDSDELLSDDQNKSLVDYAQPGLRPARALDSKEICIIFSLTVAFAWILFYIIAGLICLGMKYKCRKCLP